MRVYRDATLATLVGPEPYGRVDRGIVAVRDGEIVFAGREEDFRAVHPLVDDIPLGGRLITPGLVDCHTHLVHGGSRVREFEMRLAGASYADIARSGGGIMATVSATRTAADSELLSSALGRLDRMMACGVTTVEIKSGYGLDTETEVRMLRIARELAKLRPVSIVTTFLGAHAVPKGMTADDYIERVAIPALRAAAAEGIVDAVDAFCERIAFAPAEVERLFAAARELGLPVKLHAEQLSRSGGTALAARFRALSADHLEHVTDEDVAAMAETGTVAVLLPGAFYFLKDETKPPIHLFRERNVPMAIATDCNPGSSPMTSLPLAMNMAATLFGLTPEETLRGATAHAARALGLADRGTLAPGLRADLAIWDTDDPAEITYRIGDVPLHQLVIGGKPC